MFSDKNVKRDINIIIMLTDISPTLKNSYINKISLSYLKKFKSKYKIEKVAKKGIKLKRRWSVYFVKLFFQIKI